jgi:hypothetical protein
MNLDTWTDGPVVGAAPLGVGVEVLSWGLGLGVTFVGVVDDDVAPRALLLHQALSVRPRHKK